MEAHIGEQFEGIISGVTSWGIYVELPNTIEGMVRLEELADDYYVYEEDKYRVIGHDTGKIYSMGQKVTVEAVRVDRHARTIDFIMTDYDSSDMEGKTDV